VKAGAIRFSYLDGIRGLAAIFILTRHTPEYWVNSFYRSYLAVDLFFILSGFVIAHAYDRKLADNTLNTRKFMLVRFIRLYPIYFLSWILCSAIIIKQILSHDYSDFQIYSFFKVIIFSAFFIPSHMPGDNSLFPMNGPTWSLFFELVVNLIYVIVRPKLTDRTLIFIILIAWFFMAVSAYHHGNLDTGYKWTIESYIAGASRALYGIFLGLLLHRWRFSFSKFKILRISPWYSFLIVGVMLASPNLGRFDALVDIILVTTIIPFSVMVASKNNPTRFEGILLLLGMASYPIYILQVPISEVISYLLHYTVKSYAPAAGLILIFMLITLSYYVDKLYDSPLRKHLNRIYIKS